MTGLRERKKERTRRDISDVATGLFAEHGFERVTLAQIAEAAEVSVKTIFNHFGSKEELYFDRIGELHAAIAATIRDRPEGTTILGAMRRLLVDDMVPFPGRGWELGGPEGYRRFASFLATQDASPALRARRLVIGEQLHREVRQVIADDLGRPADEPGVLALAGALSVTMALRDEALRKAFAAAEPIEVVRQRVVTLVEAAFDRLERGFEDVDRPR